MNDVNNGLKIGVLVFCIRNYYFFLRVYIGEF